MHWNYRVIKHKNGEFHIHETYYSDKGKPISITVNPCAPYGESLQELKSDVKLFLKAIKLPALNIKLFERTKK